MKKGKSVKLNLFNPIKSVYGDHNWNRVVSSLGREIKNSVTESLDQKIFLDKNIVDLDLRTSGISKGKKSFFNLEINLFTSVNTDFRSSEIKESVKNIVKSIYQNNVYSNQYFEFSISKKTISDQTI